MARGNAFEEGKEFAKFLRELPPEAIQEGNRKEFDRAKVDYAEFKAEFGKGKCSLCGMELSTFESRKPCLHWLLRPSGFTKWHFMDVARAFGMFRMQAFLRWVANEEARAQNINDLAAEGSGKFIELTIRYKQYEWAFSCGEGDYKGHDDGADESKQPHYHFQMRVNKAAFIRYNDFHVPLSHEDIVNIEAMREAPEKVKAVWYGGEGMSDLLNDDTLEAVVANGMSAPDPDTAPIKLDTFVIAHEGSEISGAKLDAIINEAREKGVTVTSLLHKLSDVRVQTVISPGSGVVEQAVRSGRRGKARDWPQD